MAPDKPSKSRVLSDHTRVGKKFFPPAARFGWTEVHYIERILPELAWMGYFLERFGIERGLQLVKNFLRCCYAAQGLDQRRSICFCTLFKRLTQEEWSSVRLKCKATGIYIDVLDALTPFVRCYPEQNPFHQIFDGALESRDASPTEVNLSRSVIASLFDRRCQTASVVQSIIPGFEIETGQFHVPQDYPYADFDPVVSAFDSEHARSLCSHVRMNVNSSYMMREAEIGERWAQYFWDHGRDLADLAGGNVAPEAAPKEWHPIVKFGFEYEQYAWGIVDAIWAQFPVKIYQNEFSEVIGALLARQCNLAVKVATNPDLWDYHAGPLFLRAMTDVYITAAWILKDPIKRAQQFIGYGLGQEKLHVEHLKVAKQESPEGSEMLEEGIKAREAWIDSQHYTFLQHVDVGSWSGISTRKMAEEAECLDLYNFAYTGWSHCAHSTWNHVGRFDVFPTQEPLHKFIRQPANLQHGQQLDVVINATKYFDKLAVHLVDAFKIEMESPRPSDWLSQRLHSLEAELNERPDDATNL